MKGLLYPGYLKDIYFHLIESSQQPYDVDFFYSYHSQFTDEKTEAQVGHADGKWQN